MAERTLACRDRLRSRNARESAEKDGSVRASDADRPSSKAPSQGEARGSRAGGSRRGECSTARSDNRDDVASLTRERPFLGDQASHMW